MKTLQVIRAYVALKRREREAREALERLGERFNLACDARSGGERHFRLFGALLVLSRTPRVWRYDREISDLELRLARRKKLFQMTHPPDSEGEPYWRVEL